MAGRSCAAIFLITILHIIRPAQAFTALSSGRILAFGEQRASKGFRPPSAAFLSLQHTTLSPAREHQISILLRASFCWLSRLCGTDRGTLAGPRMMCTDQNQKVIVRSVDGEVRVGPSFLRPVAVFESRCATQNMGTSVFISSSMLCTATHFQNRLGRGSTRVSRLAYGCSR